MVRVERGQVVEARHMNTAFAIHGSDTRVDRMDDVTNAHVLELFDLSGETFDPAPRIPAEWMNRVADQSPELFAGFEDTLAYETRDDVGTFTGSGPVRFTGGASPGSRAYIAEEGTTNFVQNPRFVDGLSYATNWFARDFTHSADRPAELPTDTKSILCTNNTGSTNSVGASVPGSGSTARIPVASGEVLTISAYAKLNKPTTAMNVQMGAYDSGGVYLGSSLIPVTILQGITSENVWQRIVATCTIPTGVASITAVFVAQAQNTGFMGLTGVQIEKKPYATSYCDGSLGPGYSWAGTPHASASTRASAYILTPAASMVMAEKGAIVIRMKVPPVFNSYLVQVGGVGDANYLYLRTDNTNGRLASGWRKSSVWQSSVLPVASTDSYSTIILEWDGTLYRASVNGGEPLTSTITATSGSLAGNININSGLGGAEYDSILIFDRPLIDAERETLVNAESWDFDLLETMT